MINYYKFIEKFYNLITKRILGGGRQRNKTEVITLTKAETKTLLESLAEVPDHRVGNAIKYSLRDILFLGMFAILCGAETYTGIQVFSELHLEELQQNLELPHGVPSHDVFGDVFSRVDIKAVENFFRSLSRVSKRGKTKMRINNHTLYPLTATAESCGTKRSKYRKGERKTGVIPRQRNKGRAMPIDRHRSFLYE